MAILPQAASASSGQEQVILLHGLCRSSRSMEPMARVLTNAGYKVWNIDYPSRTASIEQLSESAVGRAVANCESSGATRINFVTHSMGGILVRHYLKHHPTPLPVRVVMLAPPNQGSEIVDKLGGWWLFKKINGPAGNELGTDQNSVPSRLGPANFPVGVIAGTRSINWINSLLIPGRDDGKVSVERTRLRGMADWIAIPATHPFIMRNKTAMAETVAFLRNGKFDHSLPGTSS
jgi:pimeloyl-ACP methyl ester carboxylesterase